MAQWLRICLPAQRTRVQFLVREDPSSRGATKPMRHNYWARALGPTSHNYWARMPQLLKPVRLEPVLCNKRSRHNEKPAHRNEEWPLLAATIESPRAATKTQRSPKINKKIKIFLKYNIVKRLLCQVYTGNCAVVCQGWGRGSGWPCCNNRACTVWREF